MAARAPKWPTGSRKGVDTFCQGTVVQEDFSPRRHWSKETFIGPWRHWSKETLVQGYFCSRCKCETLMVVHIDFSFLIINQYHYRLQSLKKNNLSKLINGKSFLGPKSPWTKVSLDNYPLDICPLGQRSHWTTVPQTNVATLGNDTRNMIQIPVHTLPVLVLVISVKVDSLHCILICMNHRWHIDNQRIF